MTETGKRGNGETRHGTGGFLTPEIAQWHETWTQTRARTYDLLRSLPYSVMNFSPHPGFGTLVRQLRHAADMQAAYVAALDTGRMDMAAVRPQRALEQSKEDLEAYLRRLDGELLAALRGLSPGPAERLITWGEARLTVLQHLMRLLEHEALHQGMWVFYARIADLALPESWQKRWRLE